MKLLVTGGAGFIGSNFIRYMMKKYPDYQIVNLDALTYAGNLENLKEVEENPNYKFIKGDISDKEKVGEVFENEKPDVVVNFAAESHVDRSIMNPDDFIKTNVTGTYVLLDAALKNGKIRFHHISTDEVYGSLGPNDPPFNEKNPYDPRSPYSASKAASDHLVKAYFETYGLPVTISNCTNNYGPFHFPEKIIPLFITNLLEDKKIPIYGDGENVRDWIHVDDHNRGVDMILHNGKIGETYCLGGNSETKNNVLAKKILDLLGKGEEMIEYVKDRPGHDRRYAMDYAKAQSELGWQPQIGLDEGLEKTVAWFKENENWWKNVKSGAYQKYYQKQYGK